MKKKWLIKKHVVSFSLLAISCAMFFTGCNKDLDDAIMGCSKNDIFDSDSEQTIDISNEDIYNWIRRYPDDAKLGNLTLIGTHDAGTYELSEWHHYSIFACCQTRGFTEQLERGVRVFDCRLSENMNFFHGKYYCHANLNNFFGASVNFLKKFPKEFVIAMVKAENAEGEENGYFNNKFQEFVDKFGRENFLFEKDLSNQPISKLRGKIVVITRYKERGKHGYIEGAPQINWPDDTTENPTSEANGCLRVAISDRYSAEPGTKVKVVNEVFPTILPTLEKDPTRLFIFFTTGYDSGARNKCNPRAYTDYFRDEGGLKAIMNNVASLKKGGIIMFDFIEEWTDLRNYIFVHTAPSPRSVSE